jgi:hypothetical protein
VLKAFSDNIVVDSQKAALSRLRSASLPQGFCFDSFSADAPAEIIAKLSNHKGDRDTRVWLERLAIMPSPPFMYTYNLFLIQGEDE